MAQKGAKATADSAKIQADNVGMGMGVLRLNRYGRREVMWNCLVLILWCLGACPGLLQAAEDVKLRFKDDGTFKILQIADMHYGNGRTTDCSDVRPAEYPFCSDLNTTAFIRRLIQQEVPDLIVFTGDNIGWSATDAKKSMDMAFAPAVESKIPWAAVLGNHDVESNLNRDQLMEYISQMKGSLAKVQDPQVEGTDGWGNFYLQVFGLPGSDQENFSLLNLYFLDSGDNSKLAGVKGYDWIRGSQISWFSKLSRLLKGQANGLQVPALAYFHIPLPEYDTLLYRDHITGVQQEDVFSPPVNSGFFSALREEGDVKATFVGHDHVNDYCGSLMGIKLCYGGGTGYHAYGKVGWSRRARIVVASLDQHSAGHFTGTPNITTWKRLDDPKFSKEDTQLLYSESKDVVPATSTFAYRNDCCFPWTIFKFRQGKCYFWNALILTGGSAIVSVLFFLLGFFIRPCRSMHSRSAYRLVKTETKGQD
ncbi:unnamed protein product [Calypogeia fissa]